MGLPNQQTRRSFGNTTGLTFPNAIDRERPGRARDGRPPRRSGRARRRPRASARPAAGYAVNLPAAGFNSAIGISLGNILGSFNLDAALTALERQGRGRLLSTPKITTQNNQSAEIKQGVQIPIQTVANNTVTVSFKDAVLTLKVTPQITEAGTVILTVDVENNSADFANLVNGIPPINTQSAKTQVLVRDGATAVIGGIYQSNEQTSQNLTPFLGARADPGLPVPQPVRDEHEQRAAPVHHSAHHQGQGVRRWVPEELRLRTQGVVEESDEDGYRDDAVVAAADACRDACPTGTQQDERLPGSLLMIAAINGGAAPCVSDVSNRPTRTPARSAVRRPRQEPATEP